MKIRNIGSHQTEIEKNNGDTVLVSYGTPVAAHMNGHFVKTKKHHSQTTSKHISVWLRNNGARTVLEVEQSTLDNLI